AVLQLAKERRGLAVVDGGSAQGAVDVAHRVLDGAIAVARASADPVFDRFPAGVELAVSSARGVHVTTGESGLGQGGVVVQGAESLGQGDGVLLADRGRRRGASRDDRVAGGGDGWRGEGQQHAEYRERSANQTGHERSP